MISKQQFLDSLLKEIEIIKHLYGKIPAGGLNFRPAHGQRSLLELLQYIGYFVEVEAEGIYKGQPINFAEAINESKQMPAEKFLERMDLQEQKLRDILEKLTDDDLKQEVDLFGRGQKQARSLWFFNLILKNLVGYKMQLFLYIKAAGNKDINTRNLWHGQDAQKS